MADKSKAQPSSIVLDRNEWEAFIDEVMKLVQAHDKLLTLLKRTKTKWSLSGENRCSIPAKSSFASAILNFFGLKSKRVSRRFCSYCGVAVEFGDRFCRICGKNIQVHT